MTLAQQTEINNIISNELVQDISCQIDKEILDPIKVFVIDGLVDIIKTPSTETLNRLTNTVFYSMCYTVYAHMQNTSIDASISHAYSSQSLQTMQNIYVNMNTDIIKFLSNVDKLYFNSNLSFDSSNALDTLNSYNPLDYFKPDMPALISQNEILDGIIFNINNNLLTTSPHGFESFSLYFLRILFNYVSNVINIPDNNPITFKEYSSNTFIMFIPLLCLIDLINEYRGDRQKYTHKDWLDNSIIYHTKQRYEDTIKYLSYWCVVNLNPQNALDNGICGAIALRYMRNVLTYDTNKPIQDIIDFRQTFTEFLKSTILKSSDLLQINPIMTTEQLMKTLQDKYDDVKDSPFYKFIFKDDFFSRMRQTRFENAYDATLYFIKLNCSLFKWFRTQANNFDNVTEYFKVYNMIDYGTFYSFRLNDKLEHKLIEHIINSVGSNNMSISRYESLSKHINETYIYNTNPSSGISEYRGYLSVLRLYLHLLSQSTPTKDKLKLTTYKIDGREFVSICELFKRLIYVKVDRIEEFNEFDDKKNEPFDENEEYINSMPYNMDWHLAHKDKKYGVNIFYGHLLFECINQFISYSLENKADWVSMIDMRKDDEYLNVLFVVNIVHIIKLMIYEQLMQLYMKECSDDAYMPYLIWQLFSEEEDSHYAFGFYNKNNDVKQNNSNYNCVVLDPNVQIHYIDNKPVIQITTITHLKQWCSNIDDFVEFEPSDIDWRYEKDNAIYKEYVRFIGGNEDDDILCNDKVCESKILQFIIFTLCIIFIVIIVVIIVKYISNINDNKRCVDVV